MFEQTTTPFRLWGYRHAMQAMLLSSQGLVIRNGDERVLIPRESILRFQSELEHLLQEGKSPTG
jgi:hypothetical protein